MSSPADPKRSLVLSYLGLRKAIGIIGIALPFVLVFGKLLLQGPGIQSSISHYYYTVMRDVFVGSLCAIAVFLMSYRGHDSTDNLAGKLACLFAIGVALFPITPEYNPTAHDKWIGIVHMLCAGAFFLTLAFFSLALFRKTNQKYPTKRKLQRNVVYTVCGYTILGCIGLMAVIMLMPAASPINKFAPILWLEAIAVLAFGVSWLTKGEGILKDNEA